MGEAINLVNNIKIEKVIFNCGPYNDLEQELIKVCDKKKIPYYSCIKELNIDNSKLHFLQTKEYDNENDNSNVIYTKLDGYKFMFMGDASSTTEEEILEKYNLQDIDVLKVGHHGSKTSSSKKFIDEIEPKYSIISVGKNNRYGHPNNEVLNNIKDSKEIQTKYADMIIFLNDYIKEFEFTMLLFEKDPDIAKEFKVMIQQDRYDIQNLYLTVMSYRPVAHDYLNPTYRKFLKN